MKQVRTLLDDSNLCTELGLLALCDRTGKPLCLLRNNPHRPYQEPPLPFVEKKEGLHYLLANLKTAHSFLLLQTQLLSAILPEKFHSVLIEYSCDMAHPDVAQIPAYHMWRLDHPDQALHIQGISLVDHHGGVCRLDLTLQYSSGPDYSGVLSYKFYEPLLIAITAYNDILSRLYAAGFLLMPALFPASIGKVEIYDI